MNRKKENVTTSTPIKNQLPEHTHKQTYMIQITVLMKLKLNEEINKIKVSL